nr:hypothetical protein Iba_chr04bCG7800 [Ipomoea batatas]GMC84161.1 hypothetical protein Iba_chr04cCG8960 [Ipomoea batatas]GMC85930.1 hypothetical protein Iba_chr04dCG6100 [Ipomoea batatas]
MMSAVLFSTILRPSWNAFPKLFKEDVNASKPFRRVGFSIFLELSCWLAFGGLILGASISRDMVSSSRIALAFLTRTPQKPPTSSEPFIEV